MDNFFRWIERGLLTVGTVLALWCATVLIESHYFGSLPPPSAPSIVMLPGEGPASHGRTRPTLAAGSWIAKLEVPSEHLSAAVLEGSDDDTLQRGAGHIEHTAFPGQPGNVGIAGHRDTIFRALRHLRIGERLDVTTPTHIYHYRIGRTAIVNPEDVYVLDPTDHPTLTLVTCYPFEFIGSEPQRYVVSADLVGEEARTITSGGSGQSGGSGR